MEDRTCSVEGCERPVRVKSRGWCNMHYQRWMNHGDVGSAETLRPRGEGCSIEGCDKPRHARGWCRYHYGHWRWSGDPLIDQRHRGQKLPLLEAAARSTSGDCIFLPWKYKGRPMAQLDGRQMTASRAVWVIANGDPGDLSVLHTCNGGSGESGCINIQHLYLGDHSRNSLDGHEAGRVNKALGEDVGRAVLTNQQACEIYRRAAAGEVMAGLAREYGVSAAVVRNVAHGRTYRVATQAGDPR